MKFDELGQFAKPNGASDFEDAPVICGMAVTFSYPTEYPIDMSEFVWAGKYRRCLNPKNDLSRDQCMELWSGLKAQGREDLVDSRRVTGKDFFAPSNKGHEMRCKGLKASWFQDQWLKVDMLYSAKVKPMEELNQILTILWNHPDDWFIKTYCKWNPSWAESLRKYWYVGYFDFNDLDENGRAKKVGNWRDEKDFCEWVLSKIEERIKK